MKLIRGDNQKERIIEVLAFSLAWGLFAHGMMLFNKFSFHDDAGELFSLGATYASGRWMLGLLENVTEWFFGTSPWSLPTFNGILTIILLSFSICIIAELFDLNNKLVLFFLSGCMVAFPGMAVVFGFMFTAPYYAVSILLAAGGACFICKARNGMQYVAGIVLITCSVGIYQAFLSIAMSLCLLYILYLLLKHQEENGVLLRTVLRIAGGCVTAVLLYIVITSLSLRFGPEQANERVYDVIPTGIDLIRRIWHAFKALFILPVWAPDRNMYLFGSGKFYKAYLYLLGFYCGYLCINQIKENFIGGIFSVLLLVIFPVSVNLIYVMAGDDQVYGMTTYGQVAVYILGAIVIEHFPLRLKKVHMIVKTIVLSLLIILCIQFGRIDNMCYYKANVVTEQMKSWCTILAGRIQSVEGFQSDMPVVFVGRYNVDDPSFPYNANLEDIDITPYRRELMIFTSYTWLDFFETWTGYVPRQWIINDTSAYDVLTESIGMNECYPDDGSIRVYDGKIIVKFS